MCPKICDAISALHHNVSNLFRELQCNTIKSKPGRNSLFDVSLIGGFLCQIQIYMQSYSHMQSWPTVIRLPKCAFEEWHLCVHLYQWGLKVLMVLQATDMMLISHRSESIPWIIDLCTSQKYV